MGSRQSMSSQNSKTAQNAKHDKSRTYQTSYSTPGSALVVRQQPAGQDSGLQSESHVLQIEENAATWTQSSDAGPSANTSELTAIFRVFDANGDGKISQSELGSVLECLGEKPSNSELLWMIEEVDADGDGFIDLDEFISLNKLASQLLPRANDEAAGRDVVHDQLADDMRFAFHAFDKDKDGLISATELHHVFVGLGDTELTIQDCEHMIQSVDVNHDGFVDFQEFQQMMSGSPCMI